MKSSKRSGARSCWNHGTFCNGMLGCSELSVCSVSAWSRYFSLGSRLQNSTKRRQGPKRSGVLLLYYRRVKTSSLGYFMCRGYTKDRWGGSGSVMASVVDLGFEKWNAGLDRMRSVFKYSLICIFCLDTTSFEQHGYKQYSDSACVCVHVFVCVRRGVLKNNVFPVTRVQPMSWNSASWEKTPVETLVRSLRLGIWWQDRPCLFPLRQRLPRKFVISGQREQKSGPKRNGSSVPDRGGGAIPLPTGNWKSAACGITQVRRERERALVKSPARSRVSPGVSAGVSPGYSGLCWLMEDGDCTTSLSHPSTFDRPPGENRLQQKQLVQNHVFNVTLLIKKRKINSVL